MQCSVLDAEKIEIVGLLRNLYHSILAGQKVKANR